MEFRILGPLQVFSDDALLPAQGPREQKILALLLLHADRLVPLERLVAAVWDDDPPATAATQVRNRISALRKAWNAATPDAQELLATVGNGYLMRMDGHWLDLTEFERCVARGHQAKASGDVPEAVRLWRAALGCWRGPAMAGVGGRVIEAAAARLEERRLSLIEECLDLELSLGRHADLVDEITELAQAYPFRERLVHHLLVALSQTGRQAEALSWYHRSATLLREELGIDPGPELQELFRFLLQGEAGRAVAPTAAGKRAHPESQALALVPPAELPADVRQFAGRTDELAILDRLVAPEAAQGIGLIAITGMGGVGKTALAVRWAHRLRERFPDGQLFVNLQGYGQEPPARPIDALAAMLRSLGVAAEHVPAEVNEASRLLRSVVAGKCLLFLLDNAASAEQVRPLLPGSTECLVVITSRDSLAGLVASHGMFRIMLGPLPELDATNLLTDILGRERVRAEQEAAVDLVRVCGGLPLALRIAAANLDNDRHLPISDYLKRLQDGDRLAALRIDGDPLAVDHVFDASYAALSAPARRVFRLMGLIPGADISVAGVAALSGLTLQEATRVVDRLAAASLVSRNAPDHLALHDLLRLFAKQRAAAEEPEEMRSAALNRLFSWYLDHARAAAALLHPHMLRLSDVELGRSPIRFAGHAAAVAWLDAECSSLIRVVDYAATKGPHKVGWLLADTLRGYFWLRGSIVDWLATAQAGVAAAAVAGDHRGEAVATLSLGFAHYSQGRYQDALWQYRRALQLCREARWAEGEATALGNLGLAHAAVGTLREAAGYLIEAADIDRRTGRSLGLATSLCTLGSVLAPIGEPMRAQEHLREAFELYRSAGSLSGEAMVRNSLAHVFGIVGRFEEALEHVTRALEIYRVVKDPDGEAAALATLAHIYCDSGQLEEAMEHAKSALTVADRNDRRRGLATILLAMGRIELALGDVVGSAEQYERAAASAALTGSSYRHAEARTGLAAALHARRDYAAAASEALHALSVAQRAGYRILEGELLATMAEISRAEGDERAASRYARRALVVHQRTGYRVGLTRVNALLSWCGQAVGG